MAGLLPARPCCQLSELLGVYYGSRGRLLGNERGRFAYFSLLRNAVARKVVRLGRAVARMDAKYQAVKTRKRMSFFIELSLPAELVPAFSQAPVQARPDAACDRKATLRCLFLGCGSVNAPNTRQHREDDRVRTAPGSRDRTAGGGRQARPPATRPPRDGEMASREPGAEPG